MFFSATSESCEYSFFYLFSYKKKFYGGWSLFHLCFLISKYNNVTFVINTYSPPLVFLSSFVMWNQFLWGSLKPSLLCISDTVYCPLMRLKFKKMDTLFCLSKYSKVWFSMAQYGLWFVHAWRDQLFITFSDYIPKRIKKPAVCFSSFVM